MTSADFFIIGAPKSGIDTLTSWLHSHSDVEFPKDLTEDNFATDLTSAPATASEDQQNSHTLGKIVGKLSPWYLYSSEAIPNILAQNPDAKFVVCLRDPAEIAWALHSENLQVGQEHVHDFDTAWSLGLARREGRGAPLQGNPKLLDYPSICEQGNQVARLLGQVPGENIYFAYYEDMQQSPTPLWGELQQFLKLKHEDLANYPVMDIEISKPFIAMHDIAIHLRSVKRRCLPKVKTGLRLGTRKNGLHRKGGKMKPIPQEVRQKVYDRLSEDVATLSVLADRDLMHWIA